VSKRYEVSVETGTISPQSKDADNESNEEFERFEDLLLTLVRTPKPQPADR
jgi:hypothetical protein